jgi:hypothetical protein
MGTRNLTIVQSNNAIKVAQYCQWDGYPTGQGVRILTLLAGLVTANLIPAFKERVDALTTWTPEERNEAWASVGVTGDMATMEQANALRAKHPELSRDTGAEVLWLILMGKTTKVDDNIDFAAQSLFCEWAYVVNLDDEKLEVYKGFNKTPLTTEDRFFGLTEKSEHEYHPVKMIAEYPFSALPNLEIWNALEKSDDED